MKIWWKWKFDRPIKIDENLSFVLTSFTRKIYSCLYQNETIYPALENRWIFFCSKRNVCLQILWYNGIYISVFNDVLFWCQNNRAWYMIFCEIYLYYLTTSWCNHSTEWTEYLMRVKYTLFWYKMGDGKRSTYHNLNIIFM